jgi:hypothetical protein
MIKKTSGIIFAMLGALLCLSLAVGCCTKKTDDQSGQNRSSQAGSYVSSSLSGKLDGDLASLKKSKPVKARNELNTGDPQLDESRRRKAQHYKRLEYAHQMLLRSNPQGALREIERIQMDLRDDPYLEMQTWYLSSMVYHRLGKTSRRKRSMRKMLETMEKLQKDERLRKAYQEGESSQKIIQMVKDQAGDAYAEFAE